MHLQTQQQAELVAREGFEKWAKSRPAYIDLSRFEAGYSDCNTDYAWAGWKAALAQPQQQAEPTPWRDMVVVSLVREGIDKHKARELADHFAAQRPWQGLTEQDMPSGEDPMFDHQYFLAGMVYAAKVLQERNNG